jgi:ABC-2 type transport system permease protein
VLGKFLAAWAFAAVALALTFPMWLTVNYLGAPDNGVIAAEYAGSWLMAGAFLALSSCISALTKNQVIAFVVAAAASFLFLMSGLDLVLGAFSGWAPAYVVDLVASLSFLTHFAGVTTGVIGLPTAVFLISLTLLCLFVNTQIVEIEKAG